ncbi:MAG: DnaJ domain-containing protein, partial [Deltaproteobacteria bacterium]
ASRRPSSHGPRAESAAAPAPSTPSSDAFDLPLPDMPVPAAPAAPTVSAAPAVSAASAASAASVTPPAASVTPPRVAPASGASGTGGATIPAVQIDRAGASRFTSAAPAPPPVPPGLSPEATAFWNEVIERSRAIERQNYYDMLGVPRDIGVDGVRKAYFALAKRWHPDRATGELAPLRPFVEPIFALFTSAQDTLSDEKKRAIYLRNVQDGGGTPEADRKVEAILWAAKEHTKAEVLVRQRNFEGAAALLASAIEIVNDESDLLATYAWCLFNSPNSDARLKDMHTAVDRALGLEPKHDRAHYYKGMILQRQGKEADALASFRKAVELNKKNADAVREVRLAEMRSGKAGTTGKNAAVEGPRGGEKKSDGGFLSKLFGGKKS